MKCEMRVKKVKSAERVEKWEVRNENKPNRFSSNLLGFKKNDM
jgi:hypothetical protein